MFCQKTGGDFCQTVSLAAGRARLVLLQQPVKEGDIYISVNFRFMRKIEALTQLTPSLSTTGVAYYSSFYIR